MVLIGKKEYYLDKITKDELRLNRGNNQGKDNIEDVMGKIKKFLSNRVRYKYRSTFKMQCKIEILLISLDSIRISEIQSKKENDV